MGVNIIWRDRNAYVGPFHVATVYYNDKGRAPCYRVTTKLPGAVIDTSVVRQSKIDDARKIAEIVVTHWFELAMKG
jgi:hypothetical protein